MSDATVAEVARRLARAAANSWYERRPDTSKDYLTVLTELCAVVRAEQQESEKQ
jgi:hypothetical protein